MNLLIRKSISRRFSLSIISVVALIVVGAAAALIYDSFSTFERALEQRLSLAVMLSQKALVSPMWNLNQEQLNDFIDALFSDETIVHVSIFSNNNTLASKTRDRFQAESEETFEQDSRFLFKRVDISFEEEQIGVIQIAAFKEGLRDRLMLRIQLIIAMTLVLLCAIAVTSVLITRRYITRPLSRVIHHAALIADGEFNGVHLASGDDRRFSQDEIGALEEVFQRMIAYLKEMTALATRISLGDVNVDVIPKSDDDVLGVAFQEMTRYLKQIAEIAAALADGDLREELHPRSDADALGNAFQKMTYLRETVSQIMSGSEQLDSASEEFTNMSEGMTHDMEQVSQRISVIASHSEHLSRHMNDASSATEASLATIRKILRNSTEIASVATDAMNLVSSASVSMTTLESRSKEIEGFIHLITDVAQQTNLLALNASIEAARAGEFGKGFGVVATEVKELARGAAKTVEDITHRVDAIQAGSHDVFQAINSLFEIIKRIHQFSTTVAETIEDYTLATTQISRIVNDAAENSDEITQAISGIDNVSQQIVNRAGSVQQSAQELANLADQLHLMIEQFQI